MARRCRWSVFADYSTGTNLGTRRGWQEIYCTGTKKQAKTDARAWKTRTGMAVKIERAR